ncbi:MAG: ribonuclease P protein component [Ignavibacterium sp.]|nr:MAG: ribonuclease P protein component [Ignavibacterium sp.]
MITLKSFSLNRNERVKKKKDFNKVYNSGKIIFSSDLLLKLQYYVNKNEEYNGVKIAASLSKKTGKAVWRNRVKRLIKESYRLNKKRLVEKASENNVELLLIFSPNRLSEKKNKKLYLKDIMNGVVDLINKVADNI